MSPHCCAHLGLTLALHAQANCLGIWNFALQWNAQFIRLKVSNCTVAIVGCGGQETPTRRPGKVSDVLQMHSSQHHLRPHTLCTHYLASTAGKGYRGGAIQAVQTAEGCACCALQAGVTPFQFARTTN